MNNVVDDTVTELSATL